DADLVERARRRARELEEAGQSVDVQKLIADLQQRDQRDQERSVGPLVKAEDAIVINTTELNIEQVVAKMLEVVRREKK
ncbi:MAG: (d)CMP kinase, partial [Candidatus Omnitrophica bacterium]|nr:(d)CMP kinase [Candidatus Omnitrophota bacterium]